jgi:Flp pilus assembly protein TadD
MGYLQLLNFTAAEQQLREAISLSPNNASLHYDLGLALKLSDDLPAGMAEMRKAIELDPKLVDAYYTLGITLWQQGEFAEAVDPLRKAIALKPDYAEAHYTLGTVLKQMNQLPEAAQELREAIRLQPQFAPAHTTLAAVLRQMGDTAGAQAESEAGNTLAKEKTDLQGATFATNSGKRLLNAGDVEGAIAQFRNAIKLAPSYAQAHYQLALALSRKGEKAAAAEEFAKAGQLDPKLNPLP